MLTTETTKYRSEIEEFKKFVIQQTNEEIVEEGEVPPVLNILCHDPKEPKPILALVPIPNELFRNGTTKDLLADMVIPQILNKLTSEGVDPICISMITEGWSWEADKSKGEVSVAELKKTGEKKEVVMIMFESKEACETHVFNKMGTKKNANGEYIEGVWLKPTEYPVDTKSEGRFSNLFKKVKV